MEITEARGDEDVSRCSLPWGELVIVGEVWVPMKGTQALQRLTFFSLSLLHEVGAQSLMVDLKGGLQTLTNFSTGRITSRMLPGNPSHLVFPIDPRVTSNPGELKGKWNIAWWRYRSGPPLSFYQRDLDLVG
jgi:hypothetical protein